MYNISKHIKKKGNKQMKIIAATSNAGKLREIKKIFSSMEIVSMKEAGIETEVEETGKTFEENALIKARAIAAICDCPVLSDDSGLCVDALGGAPGIYSARYAGENATDEDKYNKLLAELSGIENRTAHFVSSVVLVFPDGREFVAQGTVEGKIGYGPKGENGFGYDPVFLPDELSGKTFAEATDDEKNSISHRKRALTALYNKMSNN